jgi:hypothetical protein
MPTGHDGSRPRHGGRDSKVGGPEDNHPQIAAPLRTLRAPSAHSHLLRGPAYIVKLPQNLIFRTSVGKKDPQIRPLFGFSDAGWVKAWVKINLDSRAFGGHWARSKSAVF